jgi:tRNA (cytidine/uridine-2'-O-)-methyltransferase
LLFGSETRGLPAAVIEEIGGATQQLSIPMLAGNRSLNLSNSVAVVVYEAWRQMGFGQGVSQTPAGSAAT